MDNIGEYKNFCVDVNIQLDIFDFFNRTQLLRMIFVNRQFNHLIEEHYPNKPFIYAELKFLRHFRPKENMFGPNNKEWKITDHHVPSKEERNKMSKVELYFGGIYMFHLTALNCCCEQNVKKLLGEPKIYCHRRLNIYDFDRPLNREEADWKQASLTWAAKLHKNCVEWTKMNQDEVKSSRQIYWSESVLGSADCNIFWKHEVHDELTKNLLIHQFYCVHRNSTCRISPSLRYEGHGIKRSCPALELLTDNFSIIQQHLKHPFVRIMKLDLLRIMECPDAEIISHLNISNNLFYRNFGEEAIDFFWQKFASEICWLIEQKCIHSAARIDIDMNLLSTLILHKRKRTAAENEGQNSINVNMLVECLGHCAELRLSFSPEYDDSDFDGDILFDFNFPKMLHQPLYLRSDVYKTNMINALLHIYNPDQDPHRLISFYNYHKTTEIDLLSVLINDFLGATSPCTYFAHICTIIIEGKKAEYYNNETNEFLLISPVKRYSMVPIDKLDCLITRGDCLNPEMKAETFSLHSTLRQDVAERQCKFIKKYPKLRDENIFKYEFERELTNERRRWSFECMEELKDLKGRNLTSSIGPFLSHIFANNANQFPGEMFYNNSIVDLDQMLSTIW